MLFLGVFSVIILPLFLFVSAQSIRHGEYGRSVAGQVLEIVMYFLAILSITSSLIIIFKLI